MSYHFFAMFLGFVLDLLFGDPHWLPHPIRVCYRMDNRCGRRYP